MKKICTNPDCYLATIPQDITNFYFRKDSNKYREFCKACCNKQSNKYYKNNKIDILLQQKTYNEINKEKTLKNKQLYYKNNKEKIQEYYKNYYQNNKEKIIKRTGNYKRNKIRTNPAFRLKCNLSHSIRESLKNKNFSKKGISCIKYLPYTMQELKKHIEKQFEPWMNWSNLGKYKINKWNDDDPSTWTWQIDHIIPHSAFNYTSMEDKDFKKCWALENLRPLNAKENLLKSNKIMI